MRAGLVAVREKGLGHEPASRLQALLLFELLVEKAGEDLRSACPHDEREANRGPVQVARRADVEDDGKPLQIVGRHKSALSPPGQPFAIDFTGGQTWRLDRPSWIFLNMDSA